MNQIIKNPRITEKASNLLEGNVYTFDVADKASKNEIRKAIFAIYKVKPVRVNVAKVPKKNTKVRGVPFTKSAGRITMRHKGGGHKRLYRDVDFLYNKRDIPAMITSVEYDPNRSAFIGLAI